MARKKKTDTATAPAADTAEVPVKEAAPKAVKGKELSTSEKLKARIAAGEPLLVLVTHAGLHLSYPHADTPENRRKALSLCGTQSEGKPLTFLNDEVNKA
jgi:hypothetical protein